MSIEKITLTGHNGYLAMDDERKQGIFVFYYPPSKKVVKFETYLKKGDLKFAYNKRKQNNVNIQPTLVTEEMYVTGIIGGIISCTFEEFKEALKNIGKKSEVSQPTSDKKPEVVTVDLKKTIDTIGV